MTGKARRINNNAREIYSRYTITTKYWKYQFISPSSLYLVHAERVLFVTGTSGS